MLCECRGVEDVGDVLLSRQHQDLRDQNPLAAGIQSSRVPALRQPRILVWLTGNDHVEAGVDQEHSKPSMTTDRVNHVDWPLPGAAIVTATCAV
jgi:hypothetical protein